MREAEIEIVSAVHCRIERANARYIKPALTYEKSYWKETRKGKRQEKYDFTFWSKKSNSHRYFLTGFLTRVIPLCRESGIKLRITGRTPSSTIAKTYEPNIPDIQFRFHQADALKAAAKYKRGLIKAPTRTGKTVIQYGIYSMYRVPTLIVAHTLDLVQQLAAEGRKFGFNVAEVHGKKKEMHWEDDQIVVTTRQTAARMFKKKENDWMRSFFQLIMIDEAHHISTPDGQYAKILSFITAPLRFGFTATLPEAVEAEFCILGFLGNLIYELPINEAIEGDLLVKPQIVLLKSEKAKIPVSTKYAEVYDKGIVDNHRRNNMIARKAIEYMEQNMSVIILVQKVYHGYNLQGAFSSYGKQVEFVYGNTPNEDREIIKGLLIKKEILCAIVSVVWKEGIDIPTLDVCINAAGGVSEVATLQGVGRSLTKSDGKHQAVIVDIFDQSHHYLIRHFGERLCIYLDNGWL